MEVNKRLVNLIPAVAKTPEPIVTKFGIGDEVGDPYLYAKFYYDPIRGFCSLPHPVSARGGANSDSASFYRAAWNATRSYDEISVCPSVCLSVCPSDV